MRRRPRAATAPVARTCGRPGGQATAHGAALALATALAFLGGPGCGDELVPAGELGARLFRDPGLSTSPFNRASCATCHRVDPPGGLPATGADGRHLGPIDSGYGLADSLRRPSWWGGDALRLLDAVNICLAAFMGGRPLEADEDRARQLYELLDARSADPAPPALPVTVVRVITDLPALAGDPRLGRDIWERACRRCHGDPVTGARRVDPRAVPVPTATVAAFPQQARAAVIEKVRHGRFFGLPGVMPFYSLEVLTDIELGDLLAYLGL